MTQKLSKKFNESRSLIVVVFIVLFCFFSFSWNSTFYYSMSFKLKDLLICTAAPDSFPSGDHTL